VITTSARYRGVLIMVDASGNVQLETKPGIIMTIPAKDIRTRRPIQTLEKPDV